MSQEKASEHIGRAFLGAWDKQREEAMTTHGTPLRATEKPVCEDAANCCRELSRVWTALGITEYTGKSASEHVTLLTHAATATYDSVCAELAKWKLRAEDAEASLFILRQQTLNKRHQ